MTNRWENRVAANNGDARLEIFRLRNERMGFSFDEPPLAQLDFVAHYRKAFSREERDAALEKLLATPASVETLLPFVNDFTREQRGKFYELAERSPGTSPQACLQLAQHYLNQKRTNDAVHLLLRAKALAATLKDAAPLNSSIEALAKKISPKQEFKLEITPDLCRELGFLELTNLAQTIEQSRDFGQPLIFFGPGQRGVKIYALTVSAPQKGAYPWLFVQAEDGMRSTFSSSFTPDNKGEWRHAIIFDKQMLNILGVPASDKKQVKFTVRVGQ
jgi:hypothetical protein